MQTGYESSVNIVNCHACVVIGCCFDGRQWQPVATQTILEKDSQTTTQAYNQETNLTHLALNSQQRLN